MFKIKMQGQYGGKDDKRLGRVVGDMWKEYGFRNGIMRGYWVSIRLFNQCRKKLMYVRSLSFAKFLLTRVSMLVSRSNLCRYQSHSR